MKVVTTCSDHFPLKNRAPDLASLLRSYFDVCKWKVKLPLCFTNSALCHEDVWKSGCIYLRFLDLGTSWRRVVSLKPRSLYPQRKSPRYPLDRKLGGPQSRAEQRGEEKILDLTAASRYTDCAFPAPRI
jgi:hypothetical protein